MRAFENTPITKEQFVTQLKWHQEQDLITKGTYGEELSGDNFKGCAVGCSINSMNIQLKEKLRTDSHQLYEKYLGVPEWLARLEDTIFEGLPEARSKLWPVEFGEAIKVGSDLEKIKVPFVVYILEQNIKTLDSLVIDEKEFKKVFDCIEESRAVQVQMIEAHLSGDKDKIASAWASASSSERASAWVSTRASAWASESASAWVSTSASARASARASTWVSTSASASASASVRASARASAWVYKKYADKILELMRGCE
jgi:hypothetical protein